MSAKKHTPKKKRKKKKKKRQEIRLSPRQKKLAAGGVVCLLLLVLGFTLGRSAGTPPGPAPHMHLVERWSGAYNVDANLAAAVLEAESSGRTDAVSSSGALGLMQLMLPTAREAASELKLPEPSRGDLFDPALNTRLGIYYLSKLRQRFDDEREFVIAAYHAGPTRVDRWRKSRADLSAAEVVSELAYPETRKYVQRVLSLWKRNAAKGIPGT